MIVLVPELVQIKELRVMVMKMMIMTMLTMMVMIMIIVPANRRKTCGNVGTPRKKGKK